MRRFLSNYFDLLLAKQLDVTLDNIDILFYPVYLYRRPKYSRELRQDGGCFSLELFVVCADQGPELV